MSMRVLSRVGARELTPEEYDRVNGAGCTGVTNVHVTLNIPPLVDSDCHDMP